MIVIMHCIQQMHKINAEFVDPVYVLIRWLHFGK